jgi:hypothetical protein
MAGLDCTPAKQQAVIPYRDTAGDDLGILVVHGRAGCAYVAGPVVTVRYLFDNAFSAVAAKFHLKIYLAPCRSKLLNETIAY